MRPAAVGLAQQARKSRAQLLVGLAFACLLVRRPSCSGILQGSKAIVVCCALHPRPAIVDLRKHVPCSWDLFASAMPWPGPMSCQDRHPQTRITTLFLRLQCSSYLCYSSKLCHKSVGPCGLRYREGTLTAAEATFRQGSWSGRWSERQPNPCSWQQNSCFCCFHPWESNSMVSVSEEEKARNLP